MTKQERKNALLEILKHLKTAIVRNDNNFILSAYDLVDNMLSKHGVYVIDERPKLPNSDLSRKRCKVCEEIESGYEWQTTNNEQ